MKMLRLSGCFLLTVCLLCISSAYAKVCVGTLPNFIHDIEGQLCIIDQKTLVIEGFGYDGSGPAAYLYYYDVESGYTANNVPRDGRGEIIPHPATSGRVPGGRVSNQRLEFSLPAGVYACDLAVFTIWCDLANTHFTAINIPQNLFTEDASEAANGGKILCTRTGGGGGAAVFDNCEKLDSLLTVEWTVNKTAGNVTFRLCGCTSATQVTQDNTWMGFGLSGNEMQTQMFGADVTIAWVDGDNAPQAEDYRLSSYSQCRGGVGACPDTLDSSGNCTNDVSVVSGSKNDGTQCVTFTRKFTTGDQCDRVIDPENTKQYIAWGVGGLGETAFRHFVNAKSTDDPIHFGRQPSKNCAPLVCSTSCDPYKNQRITAASDTTFVARIGPSGNQRGYMGITGRAGWGIAWYINDTLIPELVVQRGRTYTFVVYGGDDPNQNVVYHPLYITSSLSGGRGFNMDQENEAETIYAGVENDSPIGVGPICQYTSNEAADALQTDCNSLLFHYQEALTPPSAGCGASTTGNSFTWTPDSSTPNLVYYQCYTHRNLGWKIVVTDSVEDYLKENGGQQSPTSCPSLQQSPTSCPSLQQSPTSCPSLQQSPTSSPSLQSSSVALGSSHFLLLSLLLLTSLTLLLSSRH